MLTGGYAPCLPSWPIKEVKLQGKVDGYDTDDLIVYIESSQTKKVRKLLGQIKHSISITKGSSLFGEVIQAAWNDFNNPSLFSKDKDVIALITGPLSAVDQRNVQWLLHHAKHTKDSVEYYSHVKRANFSPGQAKQKLDVFRHHLKVANNGQDVSHEEIYQFFKSFHILGYDVGGETGVVLPLLHSHISQFQQQHPKLVWGRIVDAVQTWNQHAGTVTRDNLPEDLLKMFAERTTVVAIPDDLKFTLQSDDPKVALQIDWAQHPNSAELALVALLGGWDEKNQDDRAVLCKLLGKSYEEWQPKARDILLQQDSPLTLKNGIWTVRQKKKLLNTLGPHVLDSNLDNFKSILEFILSEEDPALELPKEERYAANVFGKVHKHSGQLRQGISEGLALLGSFPEYFTNCSIGKVENTAVTSVRDLLENATWQQWATLNDLLPTISEAAPKEFLGQVNAALRANPSPFDEIFAQEGSGITERNYHTGLLWALEGLAWEQEYLISACSTLSELATHDPGGRLSNRPDNSIVTILLPWLPQTLGTAKKQNVAIQTILTDTPKIGWKILLRLLPGQREISSGTHKPKWRKTIPEDWKNEVTQDEYLKHVVFLAELAVETAGTDFDRVLELIDYFDHLPKSAYDNFVSNLSSEQILMLSEEKKQAIWDRLVKFTTKHRRFSDSTWALPEELLTPIEDIAKALAPETPSLRFRHLFSGRDMDHYEEKGNWEEQRQKLQERRQKAIQELLAKDGLDAVIEFARSVSQPREVGQALGTLSDSEIDDFLLPDFLITDQQECEALIGGYLWRRHFLCDWEWADGLAKTGWSNQQIGQFLAYLPFGKIAWARAESWLGDAEIEYWSRTPANGYQTNDDLKQAIDKLIQYERPRAAINCLVYMLEDKKPIDSKQSIRALIDGVKSSEPVHTTDAYTIVQLIKHLQSDNAVDETELFNVEWAYLPLLDGDISATPKLLEDKLATDPDFFCELIRLIYRSKDEDETKTDPSLEQEAIFTNIWKLLRNWRTSPGTSPNGEFNAELFRDWLTQVRETCEKSGHLEVAMSHIGNVLVHAPKDENGLWIHRAIAEALNGEDAGDMRHGYNISTHNARGAHWVDPTAKPEKELAEQYKEKADVVEDAGYHRFAQSLRKIAQDYIRDAERIISEHKTKDD